MISLISKVSDITEGIFTITNAWSTGITYSENDRFRFVIKPPIQSFWQALWLNLTSFNKAFHFRSYSITKDISVESGDGVIIANLKIRNLVILPSSIEILDDNISNKDLVILCIMSSYYTVRI